MSEETEFEEVAVPCPFCGEEDFDRIGLKHHLRYHCLVYEETESC